MINTHKTRFNLKKQSDTMMCIKHLKILSIVSRSQNTSMHPFDLSNASHFKAMKAAFKNAELVKPEQRSQECFVAIQQIQKQLTQITNQKEINKANIMMEKVHIIWFKNELLLAKEATDKASRKKYLEQSIKTYYTFVDKFKDSKYAPRAEKEFLKATDQLKKLNENG